MQLSAEQLKAFDDKGYDRTTGSLLRTGNPVTGVPEAVVSNVGLIPPRTYGIQVQYKFH